MRILTAAWVVPVSGPPIPRGAVAIEGDAIVGCGPARSLLREHEARQPQIIDLGTAIVVPAWVNAHTHLELSWMAAEPLPRGSYPAWVRAMIGRRKAGDAEIHDAIVRAVGAMRASGTTVLGDVGNTLAALDPLRRSELSGSFFLEVLGDRSRAASSVALADADAGCPHDRFAVSVTPHGPHTVQPALLAELAERAKLTKLPLSIHAAESREEVELLASGTGPLRAILESVGTIDRSWHPPGISPIHVLDAAGLLGPSTLAVHCVHVGSEDAAILASRGTTAVLCPRSNAALGVGTPPVALLLAAGVRLALGTDSLASNEDLDILAELAALRRIATDVPPTALIRAATLGGAEALGLGAQIGSIEPGKRATLLAVRRKTLADQAGCNGPAGDAMTRAAQDGPCLSEPYATLFAGPGAIEVTQVGLLNTRASA